MMGRLNLQDPSLKQKLILSSVVGGSMLVGGSIVMMFLSPSGDKKAKPAEQVKIEGPAHTLSSPAKWVSEVEKNKEEIKQMLQESQAQNKLLTDRVELMEKMMQQQAAVDKTPSSKEENTPPEKESGSDEMPFVTGGRVAQQNQAIETPISPAAPEVSQEKFIHLSLGELAPTKNADTYVAANTYVRAVLTSSMEVSTSEGAAQNPKPVFLRCVDDGRLPRGWRSKLKDAQVSASCYGDLSSERAVCRLETISWTERDGEVVERKIEGWILGPDGREGVRGRVIDRADALAQGAFLSGFASGLSDFIRMQATRSAEPQGILGYPKPLGIGDALQGAGGQGASNAFEKLSDYYIKRMDKMAPVIQINGGQVVDLVFKQGFHLKEETNPYENFKPHDEASTKTPQHQMETL